MPGKVLVIDDEHSIRNTLTEILSFEGYLVEDAKDGNEGLKKISSQLYDCILCDIKMPQVDGLEVFEKSLMICPEVPFIFISGHGTIETAVKAVKQGAFDFISKPPDLNELLITIRNALDKKRLVRETHQLKAKLPSGGNEIIGHSPALKKILKVIDKVAPTDARVLITGENGSGKEMIAKRIHQLSPRNTAELVCVNCAAIPTELIESELFGHEKGSFTSAIKRRIGKFEQAHEGTLFLDEIGDMSQAAQAKVLRVLEEGKIMRVGGEKEISVNVRVIAATNKDLRKEIELGNFREDLFHRLSVIRIQMPTLNERTEDIEALCQHFLTRACREYKMPTKSLTDDAIKALRDHRWRGNVRELRNTIERLVILGENPITREDIATYIF